MVNTGRKVILVGYSGHSFVVADILTGMGLDILGYCEVTEKLDNPYNLSFLGCEMDPELSELFSRHSYFVAIGDNAMREQIQEALTQRYGPPITIVHPDASVSPRASLECGSMVGPRAVVNSLARLNRGVICNSGAIVEHECRIMEFAHICPSAVLAGGVSIGKRVMIGAGASVIPCRRIADDVVLGAGSVAIRDLEQKGVYVGSPARRLRG